MVDNDDDIGLDLEERIRRQREALSQWIKEHPGERVPIQGGDLAGMDPETGEDIRKTNEERAREKEALEETKKVGILANPPEHISIPPLGEGYDEKGRYWEDILPKSTDPPNPPLPKDVNHVTITDNYIVSSKQPTAKLPDDFRGIMLKSEGGETGPWGKAQLQCLTRPDLDNTFPDTLPPEIITECHGITIVNTGDAYIVAVGGEIKGEVIYSEILPRDKYSLVVRDPIPDKEEG